MRRKTVANGTSKSSPKAKPKSESFRESYKDEAGCVWRMGQNGDAELISAPVDVLIKRLFEPDEKFRRSFMLTYRVFIEPLQLFRRFTDVFGHHYAFAADTKPSPDQLRVIALCNYWVRNHTADFADPELRTQFLVFFGDEQRLGPMGESVSKMVAVLDSLVSDAERKTVERKLRLERRMSVASSMQQSVIERGGASPNAASARKNSGARPHSPAAAPPEDAGPHDESAMELNLDDRAASLLRCSPEQVAINLTIIDLDDYRELHPRELLNKAWSRPGAEANAPTIVRQTQRFNQMVNFLASLLVTRIRLQERTDMLVFLLSLGDAFQRLNNFTGVLEVVAALNSAAVARLTHTFQKLPEKWKETWRSLSDLCSREGNFKAYRDRVSTAVGCCVPWIGPVLTDLTFLEDGNMTFTKEGLVNWFKLSRLAGLIDAYLLYQTESWKLYSQERADIGALFVDTPSLTDDEQFEFSLRVEPRNELSMVEMTLIKGEEQDSVNERLLDSMHELQLCFHSLAKFTSALAQRVGEPIPEDLQRIIDMPPPEAPSLANGYSPALPISPVLSASVSSLPAKSNSSPAIFASNGSGWTTASAAHSTDKVHRSSTLNRQTFRSEKPPIPQRSLPPIEAKGVEMISTSRGPRPAPPSAQNMS